MSTFVAVHVDTNPYHSTGIEFLRMDATLKELSERNVGKVVKSEAYDGCVQFVLEVEDDVVAKAKTILVVAKRFPGHSYTVDVLKANTSQQQNTNAKTTYELTSRYEFNRSASRSM